MDAQYFISCTRSSARELLKEGNKINENNRVLFINFMKSDSNTWQHLAIPGRCIAVKCK